MEEDLLVYENRFACNYENCNRTLKKGTTARPKSFPCTSCGHGRMELIKPTAYCLECKGSIYGNVTPPNERVPFYGKHDFVGVICSECTHKKVEEIRRWEKLLHTKFKDTDDFDEKVALYEAKVGEAKERNTDSEASATAISKIRVKTFGGRLRALRKRLGLTLAEMAEFFDLQSKSTISQYEKDVRKIPVNIKDWLRSSESIFKHLGREEGKARIMTTLRSTESTTISKVSLAETTRIRSMSTQESK